jgi:hypothetical protein
LALQLWFSPPYSSCSLPSSKMEEQRLLLHYMNRFSYISDTDEKSSSNLAARTNEDAYDSNSSSPS